MNEDLIVRPALPGDREDLAEISRTTWEGHDYLEQVTGEWLEDSGFMVAELEGRVIGCGKITPFPGKVAWLEGLRVHRDFRGRGLGAVISSRILEEAMRQVELGRFRHIEFSTYINNLESRAMAEKQGFRIVEEFHVVGLEEPSPGGTVLPEVFETRLKSDDIRIYPLHAPCGWKYPRSSESDTVEWLRRNATFWQTPGGTRFLASRRGFEISPLASALEDPRDFVLGAVSLAKSRGMDYSEMMVHDSHRGVLEAAVEFGYEYWEEQGRANVPVYRYFDGKSD